MAKELFKVHHMDARGLDSIIQGQIVDVVITSPPYFDLKDYGHEDQIGYGQKYSDYLGDLKAVFEKVFEVTKETGSLWVIIDSFKRDGELVPLPFDFAAKLREVGWKLQDIVIWKKDRTVPWVASGTTRGIFEYVLLFSKGGNYKYHADRERNSTALKKWWVKYPERYNPQGKSLDEMWEFGIPVQGSWGSGYIRHFCPLPEGLVDRIVRLTTDEGDVVLDPFSGSGTVPTRAHLLKRRYIGFELNDEYIKMFQRYLRVKSKELQNNSQGVGKPIEGFEELILNLRALKFAKVLKKEASRLGFNVKKIYVKRIKKNPKEKHKLTVVRYLLLTDSRPEEILSACQGALEKPPLSKFGIEAAIEICCDPQSFVDGISENSLFLYSEICTHKFKDVISRADFVRMSGLIISPINVEINEREYE